MLALSEGENEHSENNNLSLNLLKNEINELRRQMNEVDSRVWHLENNENDNVIFSAYKNQNDGTSVITAGQYLEGFNGFFTNFGSGFMLEYGIFTAGRKGIYEFSVSALHDVLHGGSSVFAVHKNGAQVLSLYTRDQDSEVTLSFSWIMELQHGDTIRLKVESGRFTCGSPFNCIFNGKLLLYSDAE